MPSGTVAHMRVKDAVGRFGEQIAADHLEAAGLTIVERNWRCREGELDIVASEGSELVIVEVKTRSTAAFGLPAEAVDRAKCCRIRRLAVQWIADHRDSTGSWSAVRFDVVSVLRRSGGPGSGGGSGPGSGLVVTHLRGAF